LLAASDAVLTAIATAPVAFLAGFLSGWHLGSRWELRRRLRR
jgi:hypothetical protein